MYCTKQDMLDRFGSDELIELTDTHATGDIDDEVLTGAMEDASAEIDGYLAKRYELPLPTAPQILTRFACDIARYQLYTTHAPEHVQTRYSNAVRFLRAVASGDVQITQGDGTPEATVGVAEFNTGRNDFGGGAF